MVMVVVMYGDDDDDGVGGGGGYRGALIIALRVPSRDRAAQIHDFIAIDGLSMCYQLY
jgi:hypothetical protein